MELRFNVGVSGLTLYAELRAAQGEPDDHLTLAVVESNSPSEYIAQVDEVSGDFHVLLRDTNAENQIVESGYVRLIDGEPSLLVPCYSQLVTRESDRAIARIEISLERVIEFLATSGNTESKINTLIGLARDGSLTIETQTPDRLRLIRGDDFTGDRAIRFPFLASDPPAGVAVFTVRDWYESREFEGTDGRFEAVVDLQGFMAGHPPGKYKFDCEFRPTEGDNRTVALGTLDLVEDQSR